MFDHPRAGLVPRIPPALNEVVRDCLLLAHSSASSGIPNLTANIPSLFVQKRWSWRFQAALRSYEYGSRPGVVTLKQVANKNFGRKQGWECRTISGRGTWRNSGTRCWKRFLWWWSGCAGCRWCDRCFVLMSRCSTVSCIDRKVTSEWEKTHPIPTRVKTSSGVSTIETCGW